MATTVKKATTPKKTTAKKAVSKTSGLTAPLYNLSGESMGQYDLPKSVFGVKVNQDTISMALRVYRSNQRSAHAKAKDRGEVSGTTKKMWSQKGTGRARHGSAKAPIFVGGGSAHGPQGNQNFKLKLNQKVKTVVFNSLLSKFAADKSIIVVDRFDDLAPKTKEAWNFVDKLEKANETIANSAKIGIITHAPQDNVKRAFANIPGINYFSLMSLSSLNLAGQNFLILSRSAVEQLIK